MENSGSAFTASVPPEIITGLWDSYSDSYVISASCVEYDDGSGGAWRLNFAGDIKYVSAFDDTNGVIIIEYTKPSEIPYETGASNFLGIYYRILSSGAAKFWNSYDTTGTDTLTLEEAIEKFSGENSSRFVFSWDSAYTLFRQDTPILDMGPLRGNWRGDDDFGSWLKITDYRMSVYMAVISPATIAWSGAIADMTDPAADRGHIFVRFSADDDAGLVSARLDAVAGDYYAVHWRQGGEKTYFSVYNDNPAALSKDLAALKSLAASPLDIFAETKDLSGGLAVSGSIYAGFVKRNPKG